MISNSDIDDNTKYDAFGKPDKDGSYVLLDAEYLKSVSCEGERLKAELAKHQESENRLNLGILSNTTA